VTLIQCELRSPAVDFIERRIILNLHVKSTSDEQASGMRANLRTATMNGLLTSLCTMALFHCASLAAGAGRFEATEGYAQRTLEGWRVLVHPEVSSAEAELGERVLALLRHQLYEIDRRLPAPAVAQLRKVTIWVELNEPHHPCMVYHPDATWLAQHDMNPDKARSVEIANAATFLVWTIEQPWMVLHELAHAYHHQFLEGGFENAELAAAHQRARSAHNYESVLRINGRRDRHYAITNPMEYFAEASEAYFGTNDFYPFVRSELAEHDPPLFELMGKLWDEEGNGARELRTTGKGGKGAEGS
jgi:hypothetical protein